MAYSSLSFYVIDCESWICTKFTDPSRKDRTNSWRRGGVTGSGIERSSVSNLAAYD